MTEENNHDGEQFDLEAWLAANAPEDLVLPASFASDESNGAVSEEDDAVLQEADALNVPIVEVSINGAQVDVTRLDALSSHLRRTVVGVIRAVSPRDYAEYKAIKFAGVPRGKRPSIAQARRAYGFLFERFLELSYRYSGF